MPFTVNAFIRTRPYLYHLTSSGNLDQIIRDRCLWSTKSLLIKSGQNQLFNQRRENPEIITIQGDQVSIRDQAPLHQGHIAFEEGWNLPRFIELLNQRVFFWPGTPNGQIDYGKRHFNQYATEQSAVIRIRAQSLIEANPNNP